MFEAAETKMKQPIAVSFPADLVPALTRYLEHYRPVLSACGLQGATCPTDGVWVSTHGTMMSPAAIGFQVASRTEEAFGLPVSPHLFRDSVATSLAIAAPEQVGLIRPLLGHTTMATSERHYNLAGSLEAGRRFTDTIEALRRPAGRAQTVREKI